MSVFQDILFDETFDQLNNMVRWNGMSRVKDETVSQHSFLVTWFSRILAEGIYYRNDDDRKLAVTTYAIFHDFDEIFTQDVSHILKYNKFNGHKVREVVDYFIEDSAVEFFSGNTCSSRLHLDNILSKDVEPKLIVKVADWLSMAFYIKKEIELGNKTVQGKYKYCIEMLGLAVDKCIDHFENGKQCKNLTMLKELKTINWKYNE